MPSNDEGYPERAKVLPPLPAAGGGEMEKGEEEKALERRESSRSSPASIGLWCSMIFPICLT